MIDDYLERLFHAVREQEIATARVAGLTSASALPSDLEIADLRHLYWEYPAVSTTTLLSVTQLRNPQELLAIIGPVQVGTCTCDRPIMASSRSARLEFGRRERKAARPQLCAECRVGDADLRDANWKAQRQAHADAIESLRVMPYVLYLRSGHWQKVRAAALKRARFACQACNSPRPLDVHHRTYERRGYELASDVIVLCRPCHSTFHERRALAQ
jgi:hypothetical protein